MPARRRYSNTTFTNESITKPGAIDLRAQTNWCGLAGGETDV